MLGRALRRGAADPPAPRGRPDAGGRRRAARPAHDRRDRQHLEVASRCFAASLDPWKRLAQAADDDDPRGGPLRARADGAVGARRLPRAAARRLRPRGRGRARAAATPIRSAPARASRTAPPTGARDASADPRRAPRRAGVRAGQHARELRRGARGRRRHDRVRRPARRAAARGELYVAHDYGALDRARSLDAGGGARALQRPPPFAGIRLQLDIKRRGIEERGASAALDASGTRSRAFISTGLRGVLRALSRARPGDPARLDGARHPGDRRRRRRLAPPLPPRASPRAPRARIRAGEIDALVAALALVDAPARRGRRRGAAARSTCGRSTTPPSIARLAALGVTGVITNDPRLFARSCRPTRCSRAGRRRRRRGGRPSSSARRSRRRGPCRRHSKRDDARAAGRCRAVVGRDREVLARLAASARRRLPSATKPELPAAGERAARRPWRSRYSSGTP